MLRLVALLALPAAARAMCANELSVAGELKLLRKWCEARGDEPTRCASVGVPSWADTNALNDSATQRSFLRLLAARPMGTKEYCGMSVNHVYAMWSTLRAVQPPVVVESGVLKGQGTWLIRQTLPSARIFCLDPSLMSDAWRDPSPLTTYLTERAFSDFGALKWAELVPDRRVRAASLVLLDDHMSAVRRVAEAIDAGFGHLFYEDNWKYFGNAQRSPIGSDCYSFNTLCSWPLPLPLEAKPTRKRRTRGGAANQTVLYRDHFGRTVEPIRLGEHEANLAFLLGHATRYVEFPALFDACMHLPHPRPSRRTTLAGEGTEQMLFSPGFRPRAPRSRAPLLAHAQVAALLGEFGSRLELISWNSYYPPYVRLARRLNTSLLRYTTPWRLGSFCQRRWISAAHGGARHAPCRSEGGAGGI